MSSVLCGSFENDHNPTLTPKRSLLNRKKNVHYSSGDSSGWTNRGTDQLSVTVV